MKQFGNAATDTVDELPDEVRLQVAVPRIITAILDLEAERVTWDQIRAMGALNVGGWSIEFA